MILLHSIVPEKNRYRRYAMDLQLSLFGGVYLTTSWGRIDGIRQQKRDYWFEDESKASKKARSILKTRLRHKYQVLEEGFLTMYKLLTDWGSFIAGILALLAGGIAYYAGVKQAKATREASDKQIDAIRQQRNDEIINVREAAKTEVKVFANNIIGALLEDLNIALATPGSEDVSSAQKAAAKMQMMGDPTIYPAIADRIGLLPVPADIVKFYMQVVQAKVMANHMINYVNDQRGVASYGRKMAECFIMALELAESIIDDKEDASSKEIDKALASTRRILSFKDK